MGKHALLHQIKNLCSQPQLISQNKQCTFNAPEHMWKTKTPNAIKSWIQKHKPIMQMAVRAAKQRQKINTPDIRTHLSKIMKRRKPKPSILPKKSQPSSTKQSLRQSMLNNIPGFKIYKNHKTGASSMDNKTPNALPNPDMSPTAQESPDHTNHRKFNDPITLNHDL